jgi:hypothetical protein
MNLDKQKKSKHPGSDRRWTLLFIGDHGNVITVKRFKTIVFATLFVFLIAIGAVAALVYLNKGTLQHNQELQKRIENSQKKIETLRHEKEILMARLVLSESKAKKNVAQDKQGPDEIKRVDQLTSKTQVASKTKPEKANKKKPPAQATFESKRTSVETPPVLSVAVENFKIAREPDSQDVNAQFKIKNTSSGSQKVAGYAVVVLKSENLQTDKWLVMPAVGLVGDKPSGKRGTSFAIQRFRTMNFTSKAPNYSDQFQIAAVYVFSKSGQMLLEQDFPIELPPPPVATTKTSASDSSTTETSSSETSPSETSSSEASSSETSPSETSSSETSSSETSSSQTPLSEELIKALKNSPPDF